MRCGWSGWDSEPDAGLIRVINFVNQFITINGFVHLWKIKLFQMPSHIWILLPAAAPQESASHAEEEDQDLDEGHARHAKE